MRSKYLFGIFSVSKIIHSISFRKNDYLSGTVFYLFGRIFGQSRLITVFSVNENGSSGLITYFSGLIIPKLLRICRYFPKLLIVSLYFRLSIRVFCRNFVDISRGFVETAGKMPKKYPDRCNSNLLIYLAIFRKNIQKASEYIELKFWSLPSLKSIPTSRVSLRILEIRRQSGNSPALR